MRVTGQWFSAENHPAWRPNADAFGTRLRTACLKTVHRTVFLTASRPLRVQVPKNKIMIYNNKKSYQPKLIAFGASDGTWTRTRLHTRPSNVPVCLFQHTRICDYWIIALRGINVKHYFRKIAYFFNISNLRYIFGKYSHFRHFSVALSCGIVYNILVIK